MIYLSPNKDECYMEAAANYLTLNWGTQKEQVTMSQYVKNSSLLHNTNNPHKSLMTQSLT